MVLFLWLSHISMQTSILLAGLTGTFITSLTAWWLLKGNKDDLPPLAPGCLPFIGHLLALASKDPPEKLFLHWSKQIGPIFTLKLGIKRWIILNDAASVKDLIVSRGSIYSSRDVSSVLTDGLFDGGKYLIDGYLSCKYITNINIFESQMVIMHSQAHSGLTKKKINDYQPLFDKETQTLLQTMNTEVTESKSGLGVPICRLIEDYSMLVVLKIAFGDIMTMKPGDKELQKVFELTAGAASFLGPKEQLLEFFPFLKRFLPTQHSFAVLARDKLFSFYGSLFEKLDKESSTRSSDCFFKAVIGQLTHVQRVGFAGVFVGAGSETTASTLQWLIAILTNYPEIQDKVYDEIVSVVGEDRLPAATDGKCQSRYVVFALAATLSDVYVEAKLVYLQCVILETLRFRTPTPLGVPHATSSSDVYKNYVIPANATVVVNAYAIHRDPERYTDPESFLPARHMKYVTEYDSTHFSQTVEDRPHLAFSTGRRVCVGIHLAERSLFMAAARMLACYRFEGKTDLNRSKDGLSTTFAPVPFTVRLVKRHENVDSLITNNLNRG
ncbi:hypothetical protein NQZ79_g1555 [Umbelopsis isabellina]|nr:hypothetical protein NQZ79_g1555 [Umbelopsis isabellina]